MNDKPSEKAEAVVRSFRKLLDTKTQELIGDARFEELTLFIQAAISEELTAAADQVEKVVRSIRRQTEKRQLEL